MSRQGRGFVSVATDVVGVVSVSQSASGVRDSSSGLNPKKIINNFITF